MNMKANILSLHAAALLTVIGIAGCARSLPQDGADTIYYGGDIVTINDALPTAEALAVKDGKILAVRGLCR